MARELTEEYPKHALPPPSASETPATFQVNTTLMINLTLADAEALRSFMPAEPPPLLVKASWKQDVGRSQREEVKLRRRWQVTKLMVHTGDHCQSPTLTDAWEPCAQDADVYDVLLVSLHLSCEFLANHLWDMHVLCTCHYLLRQPLAVCRCCSFSFCFSSAEVCLVGLALPPMALLGGYPGNPVFDWTGLRGIPKHACAMATRKQDLGTLVVIIWTHGVAQAGHHLGPQSLLIDEPQHLTSLRYTEAIPPESVPKWMLEPFTERTSFCASLGTKECCSSKYGSSFGIQANLTLVTSDWWKGQPSVDGKQLRFLSIGTRDLIERCLCVTSINSCTGCEEDITQRCMNLVRGLGCISHLVLQSTSFWFPPLALYTFTQFWYAIESQTQYAVKFALAMFPMSEEGLSAPSDWRPFFLLRGK